MRLPAAVSLLALLLALLGGCDEPCVEDLDPACAPLASDTSWSNVYEVVIVSSCATEGVTCHASAGRAGGLDLGDADTAYEALTTTEAYVVPGDAACSDLVKRIHSDRAGYEMPPGSALSAPEACMIQRWIDAGAEP